MVFRIVTPNPALDRLVVLPALYPGASHRALAVETVPAGKGVNVARALVAWGGDAVLYATAGGPAGQQLRAGLERAGVPHVITPIEGDTRINIKVSERRAPGRITEIDEPGPLLAAAEEEAFVESVCRDLQPGDWLVLSGSLPPGVSPAIYIACLSEAEKKGCRVALDAPGPTLAAVLQVAAGSVDLVAPNAEELGYWWKHHGAGGTAAEDGFGWIRQPGSLRAALAGLGDLGVAFPFATLGGAGAALWTGKAAVRARALDVPVRHTVGCGDVFLAAVLLALEERGGVGALRLATALAGLKAARDDGLPPDWFDGEERVAEVQVEAL